MTDKRPEGMTGREFIEQFPGLALALAEMGRAAVAAGFDPNAPRDDDGRAAESIDRTHPVAGPDVTEACAGPA